jgi:hypothetical protein
MEYDPQTMSEREMEKRLQLFENEFHALTESMDIITTKTSTMLQALDIRLNEAIKKVDSDQAKMKPVDA